MVSSGLRCFQKAQNVPNDFKILNKRCGTLCTLVYQEDSLVGCEWLGVYPQTEGHGVGGARRDGWQGEEACTMDGRVRMPALWMAG